MPHKPSESDFDSSEFDDCISDDAVYLSEEAIVTRLEEAQRAQVMNKLEERTREETRSLP